MSEPQSSKFPFLKAAAAALLTFGLASGPAVRVEAQTQGKIEGRALDAAGIGLDKVSVVIQSQRTSAKIELSTNKDGRFTQIGLEPGYYLVTLNKPGFSSRSVEIKVSIAESSRFEARLEAAEAAIERALSDADKQFVKGNKLYAEGQYAGAAQAYQEAVRFNAAQWSYHFNLGLAHKKLGRGTEALAAFAKAQELNPSSYGTNKELAESLGRAGRMDEAKEYYLKAVEISPDDPDCRYNLGLTQAATGDSAAAAASFEKCLELKPDYADAYYQLGTVEIGLNKVPDAVGHLEKFLEIAPGHERAPIARQLVEALKK